MVRSLSAAAAASAAIETGERRNLCRPGDVLGGTYRVERLIGAGGMGEVYEVKHVRLGARFAAKVLRAQNDAWPDAERRFRREAAALATVRSEHVVKVFDVSEPGAALPFYVMELLEGQDLRRLLAQEGVLDVERAVRIAMDACVGVAAMHDAGLVHRDLKPANLFLTRRDDGQELTKLLDFGVTKQENVLATTSPGAFVGTLRYVPPEQIENSATVGKRADVYALGVILYEALAGRPAYEADSVERLIYSILNTTPESLVGLNPHVPAELAELLRRAMARDVEARLPRILDLHDGLRAFLEPGRPNGSVTLRDAELPAAAPPAAARATPTRVALLALGALVMLEPFLLRERNASHGDAPIVARTPPASAQREPAFAPHIAPNVVSVASRPGPAPSAGAVVARPTRPLPSVPPPPVTTPHALSGLSLEHKNPYDR